MDTKQVAEWLGITPRLLRQFLRSPSSTFMPVGSGARYDFTQEELPTLKSRFDTWQATGKPGIRKTSSEVSTELPVEDLEAAKKAQLVKDRQVWAEEEAERAREKKPSIAQEMSQIRNPRVRARALADASAAEDRLLLQLLANGLHITQLGDRNSK